MFRKLLALNLKSMLKSREFFFSFLISLLIFLVPACIDAILLQGRDIATLAPAWCYFGAVNHITDVTLSDWTQVYFIFFFPFLASMAYSFCAFDDKQAGINMLIIERSGRDHYYKSQAIVTFVGGFLIVLIPELLSELAMMIAVPLQSIKITPYYPLEPDLLFRNVNFFRILCYNYPYLYYLIYNIIGGIFGGLIGLLSYSMSLHLKVNRFLVITLPGIIYLVLTLFLNIFALSAMSPNLLVVPPTNTEGIKLEYILIFGGGLILINFLAVWSKIHLAKDEL
ncbi:hypothetical protein CAFE_09650 [Caprobacter fermentans]|uniref:Uncharacterized protein n=1 Tax=Caproicibacter fermentans TaxID=2576756 RepID=A0A6N8HY68_9FIRM|nr:hypothetical protein [Caproicibacter fermentans]MVB10283.1 hypothetical protein [Caproicibacter fermentans]